MNETFPDWLITYQSEEAWKIKFEELKKFYDKNERLPKQREEMGVWLYTQRQAARGKNERKISNDQKKLMDETFPEWLPINIKSDDVWQIKFEKLKEFYIENKRLPTRKEELGSWLNNQRNMYKGQGSGKMANNRKEMMDDTFPMWVV
jgi:hypothetical protein